MSAQVTLKNYRELLDLVNKFNHTNLGSGLARVETPNIVTKSNSDPIVTILEQKGLPVAPGCLYIVWKGRLEFKQSCRSGVSYNIEVVDHDTQPAIWINNNGRL